MIQRRFIDQTDADRTALEYLQARGHAAQARSTHVEIRWQAHEHPGSTGVLWVDGRVSAVSVVTRDERQRSLVVTFEPPGSVPEAAAGLITSLPTWPPTEHCNASDDYARGFREAVRLCESVLQDALRPEALAQTLSRSLDQASAPDQTALTKQMMVFWRRLWRRSVAVTAKA